MVRYLETHPVTRNLAVLSKTAETKTALILISKGDDLIG